MRSLTNVKIIDLSQDFGLAAKVPTVARDNREFVYGLPELNRERIRSAHKYCQSGLFCHAIQLGLLPLAKAGLLKMYILPASQVPPVPDKVFRHFAFQLEGK